MFVGTAWWSFWVDNFLAQFFLRQLLSKNTTVSLEETYDSKKQCIVFKLKHVCLFYFHLTSFNTSYPTGVECVNEIIKKLRRVKKLLMSKGQQSFQSIDKFWALIFSLFLRRKISNVSKNFWTFSKKRESNFKLQIHSKTMWKINWIIFNFCSSRFQFFQQWNNNNYSFALQLNWNAIIATSMQLIPIRLNVSKLSASTQLIDKFQLTSDAVSLKSLRLLSFGFLCASVKIREVRKLMAVGLKLMNLLLASLW